MNFNRRGIFEIICNILEPLSHQPLKKTHLGHKANIDTVTLNKYLDMLLDLGLIEHRLESSDYAILPNGHLYLQAYEKVSTLINKESQLTEVGWR